MEYTSLRSYSLGWLARELNLRTDSDMGCDVSYERSPSVCMKEGLKTTSHHQAPVHSVSETVFLYIQTSLRELDLLFLASATILHSKF